ncbi:hypothetical protein U7230_08345 [Carboxydochorda subterranea]|uniref:Cytochrome c domain-containing protein n=1 Tax=Carboxydichorda subterranea TaxID=3109565 RepID=A0ABZ1BTY5_9FIRM|nr:hypothetical protein [Limnochorda sp. L945t]WRP16116.1 hypothetical protein U7230_08345 [Limnochorda sp. L945t]
MGSGPSHVLQAAWQEAVARPGCPICNLVEGHVRRHFDAILWELVNDPGVRRSLRRSLGLCPRHLWQLDAVNRTVTHDMLGEAILLHDVLEALGDHLQAGRHRPHPPLDAVKRAWQSCPACRLVHEVERDYLDLVVASLRRNDDAPLPILCPDHLALAPDRGGAFRVRLRAALAGAGPGLTVPLGARRGAVASMAEDGRTACPVCQVSFEAAERRIAEGPDGQPGVLCRAHRRMAASRPAVAGRWDRAGQVWIETTGGAPAAPAPCPACHAARDAEAAASHAALPRAPGPPTASSWCLPHLVEHDQDHHAEVPWDAAPAHARELERALAGFIAKQDWRNTEPLTPAERTAVRDTVEWLAGFHVAGHG